VPSCQISEPKGRPRMTEAFTDSSSFFVKGRFIRGTQSAGRGTRWLLGGTRGSSTWTDLLPNRNGQRRGKPTQVDGEEMYHQMVDSISCFLRLLFG
jgi:hypothetical protein